MVDFGRLLREQNARKEQNVDTRTIIGIVKGLGRPNEKGLCELTALHSKQDGTPLQYPTIYRDVPDPDLFGLKIGDQVTVTVKKGRAKPNAPANASDLTGFFWDYQAVAKGNAPTAPQATATAQTPAQRPPIPTFPPATTAQPQTAAQAPSQGPAADGVPHQHTFTVSYGRTINRGNFESERIDFSMEFDRGEMAPQAAYVRVKATVLAMLGAKEPSDEPEPDDNANPENDLPF